MRFLDLIETAHDRADDFVSSKNLTERVCWLQQQGISDVEILDALLEDDDDKGLDGYTRDVAHQIASNFVNGTLDEHEVPPWLR